MAIAILGFSGLISFAPSKNNKKFFLLLSFFILFLFAALRENYGNDYASYLNYFNIVKSGQSSESISELGYRFINQIIPDFHLLLAIISLVYLFMIYKLVTSCLEPKLYPFALLIFLIDPYLFLQSLSMIRESIAIVLFYVALFFASKKRIVFFVIFIILASLFHTSAIILFPAYFLCNEKRANKISKYLLIIAPLLGIAFYDIGISNFISYILGLIGSQRYIYYFKNVDTNSLRATILTYIIYFYVCWNYDELSGKQLICAKLTICALFLEIFGFKVPMIGRIGKYFMFFSIVCLPAIFTNCLKSTRKKFMFGQVFPITIIAIYVLRLYSFFTNPMWKSFLDYETFL